ncbi:hypothetical protein J6590_104983, partial [Homalodisca vitripennis]
DALPHPSFSPKLGDRLAIRDGFSCTDRIKHPLDNPTRYRNEARVSVLINYFGT